MSYLPISGASRWLVVAMALILWSGCTLQQPLQRHSIGDVGHFEYREPDIGFEGIMVAVPRGAAEPDAIDYAHSIRDRLGAGLVVAYDFATNRIPVDRPLLHSSPIFWPTAHAQRPSSVYPDFQALLQPQAGHPLKFYIGVRIADESRLMPRIEVASGGISFEQLEAIEQAYAKIRDRLSANSDLLKVEIALSPRHDISWKSFGVKNHGVLMLAERGLILRLPKVLATPGYRAVYREILANWVREASAIAGRASAKLPPMQVQRLRFGRIDSIAGGKDSRGTVIAAPHGSFDGHTGELVEELSYRTALPAVMTRGFTPNECGGWRINVNRPTELRYPTETIERSTGRAKEVYEQFKKSVFAAARGPLNLYIDMHQNGTQQAIEVATLGITREQATAIKTTYKEVRDRMLSEAPEVAKVDLLIEPLDQVDIGAWAAKDHGILRLARSSLHFELPAQRIFYRDATRRVYTRILAELVSHLVKSQAGMVEAKVIALVPPL